MNRSSGDRVAAWADLYGRRRRETLLVHLWGDDSPPDRPLPNPDRMEDRFAWSLAAWRRQAGMMEWLDDDALPFLDPYTGTEIFAEAFGCPVRRPENHMPFALPRIRDSAGLRSLRRPRAGDPPLAALFEMADRLRAAAPGALMRLPDIQSPFGIAALVWEKAGFLAALHEEPEAAEDLVAMAEELLTEFLDLWFARYGSAFIAHFPVYYMPRGVTLSEDEAGAISPEMFRRFAAPSLDRLSARYGALGIHCCANARHQWQNIKDLRGLAVLNLVQPDAEIVRAVEFFGDACCHLHYPAPGKAVPETGCRRVREVHCGNRGEAIARCRERGPA